jgi:hypothetical protein
MNDQRVYVFNQYYIDLLKKIKTYAKNSKETSKPARDILRAIKKNYASMDKLADSYIGIMDMSEVWTSYDELEDPFSFNPESFELYNGMNYLWVKELFTDKYTLHHYLMILNLFRQPDLDVDNVVESLKFLTNKDFEEKIKVIESEYVKEHLMKIKKLHSSRTSNLFENELKDLESTTLGKLAKEIMSDINVEELQQSFQNESLDILGSLQNPNSGFGKLISSVSTKMLSKLASGEIQQEKLLEDAFGLASKLPGMLPGDIGKNMGGLGNMLSQLQKMGLDPSNMMKGMGMNGAQKSAASSRMNSASRKNKMSEHLKQKIREKASKEK